MAEAEGRGGGCHRALLSGRYLLAVVIPHDHQGAAFIMTARADPMAVFAVRRATTAGPM